MEGRGPLPLFIGFLGVIIACAVYYGLGEQRENQQQNLADAHAREALELISKVLTEETKALNRLGRRMEVLGGKPGSWWHEDAKSYLLDFSSLESVGWTDRNYIVRAVEHRRGNMGAVNFDLRKRPVRFERLKLLAEANTAASSGPVDLISGGRGFVYDVPLLAPDGTSAGFVHGVFVYKHVVNTVQTADSEPLPLSLTVDGDTVFNSLGGDGHHKIGKFTQIVLGEKWEIVIACPISVYQIGSLPWPEVMFVFVCVMTLLTATSLYFRQLSIGDAKAARVAETRLQEALNALDIPFAYFDADDRLRIWNWAYVEMHTAIRDVIADGVSYKTLLEALVERGVSRNAIGREEDYIAERLRFHESGEFRGERQLSTGRWVTSREFRVSDGGTAAIWTDVTRLKEQQFELIKARNLAEAANEAKSGFLANMSHELRTPLNAINGFSDVIRNQLFGPLPDRYRAYAQDIHESGQHLLSLINDILDLAKIEAGAIELKEQEFLLSYVFDSAVRMVRERANEYGLSVEIARPDPDYCVNADFRLVKQILVNLLSNSVKFTPEGGKITLSAEISGDDISIAVSDTGIGMTKEEIKMVLEPFVQAGDTGRDSDRGTGLGLTLVQNFVDLHGGSLEIKSVLSEGTTVTVRFPGRGRISGRPDELDARLAMS